MEIEPENLQPRPCPICGGQTNSLKQMRVISMIFATPVVHASNSTVYRGCPQCMRAYIWRKCFINGLTTFIVGYIVLVPYSLVLTLFTLRKGHSLSVLHGITPEMEENAEGIYEPTRRQKMLALVSLVMWMVPVVGVIFCPWVVWETRLCLRGWVRETTEFASLASYFATVISIGLFFTLKWN